MLNSQTINKIEEFVYQKPRSIKEISEYLDKNWRTADRYVEEIENNYGTISTRVFRGGTRGALKIVYWSSVEKVSHSIFQEKLEQDISSSKKKEDFSAFDIFQYIPEKNRAIHIQNNEEENISQFRDVLLSAKKQVLLFSGNLSLINLKNEKHHLLKTFEELVKRKVKIKIICRVDLTGQENIKKTLSLNLKHGEDSIEIRHNNQPLRGCVIDNKVVLLKEVQEPTGKIKELNKKMFIFYNISDKSWVEWLSKLFWKKFSDSIDGNKRIEQLNKIKQSYN